MVSLIILKKLMTRYLYYTSMPFIVLLAALSLSCIVGYFIVQLLGDIISFRQIINRLAQLFLVLSIFPAMAYLKIDKTELGFAKRPMFFKQLLQGFLLGFVTLMPVFIVLYILGVNVIDEGQLWTTGFLTKQIIINLLIALLISSIEEPLFRGILLTSLSKKLSTAAAIIISSTYYAGLHFFSSKTDIPLQDITLFSGFKLLAEAFSNLWNAEIISAFLALLMVGIFFRRTQNADKSQPRSMYRLSYLLGMANKDEQKIT
jgi:CAAX protease family protein